jgi:hypothetical protein
MSETRKILNPQKTFAVAYRIFQSLGEEPKRSADYAEQFSVSLWAIKSVVSKLSQLGCITTKRGKGKLSGISKLQGVTIEDLFQKFNVPYQQGDQFEKEIDSLVKRNFTRTRRCEICGNKHKEQGIQSFCLECKEINGPIYQKLKLARCGHLSATRYFKCEECKPTLEDNTTPEDFGCVVSL